MVERFFFNRVNAQSTGAAVRGQDKPLSYVLTDKTEPPLAFSKAAGPRTKTADNMA